MKNNYYQKHKERLQKEACEKYQNLYEEGKDKWQKRDIKILLKKKKKKSFIVILGQFYFMD